MSRLVSIKNGCNAEIAEYKEMIIPEYVDNPLIEALPALLTDSEVIEKIAFYPEYISDERNLDKHYRIHMVNRLFQVFQPLPMNIELENKIARTIRQGYVSRNPLSREYASSFNNVMNESINEGNKIYNNNSSGFYFIGVSGIGKTTALHHVLNLYPQVISHSAYHDKPLSMYQLVWLKQECPHDGSIKGLMLNFFEGVDKLLGTNYFKKACNATTDKMVTIMNKVALNTSLGLLVIDEIQHLSLAKSGGRQKMLNFFVNLINTVGIPVILVGTPAAMGFLVGEFRMCRRGIGVCGDMVCDRLQKDRVWELLLNSIWHYQWTLNKIELNDELNNILYAETQGIPDLLIKLYAITQIYSISSGIENITTELIKKVARDNFKLVQPMIRALKSGSIREISRFEDLYIPNFDFNEIINKSKESIKLNYTAIKEARKNDIKEEKQKFILDNTDMQFGTKKSNQHTSVDELSLDDIRLIVHNGANKNKNAYGALKECGYIRDISEVIQ